MAELATPEAADRPPVHPSPPVAIFAIVVVVVVGPRVVVVVGCVEDALNSFLEDLIHHLSSEIVTHGKDRKWWLSSRSRWLERCAPPLRV